MESWMLGMAALLQVRREARTEVTIQSHGSPDVRCLTTVRPGVTPLAGTDATCPTDDLVLYWNGPVGVSPNYLPCINGSGLLNLNQNFYGLDWNDEASAWWTGCRDVYFYVDINRGGGEAFEYVSYPARVRPRASSRTREWATTNSRRSTSRAATAASPK